MAAVEYGECPSIHTSRLARFEYGIRVLEVYFFSPDLNWNVLRTTILSTQYGQYGYWNTAQVSCTLGRTRFTETHAEALCSRPLPCGCTLHFIYQHSGLMFIRVNNNNTYTVNL
ncbi:unnamed protein product, partial [Boreogadus saida]